MTQEKQVRVRFRHSDIQTIFWKPPLDGRRPTVVMLNNELWERYQSLQVSTKSFLK
jgi:hypothetical protein